VSAVKGYDMSRYWRLVSVEGIVSGTFWVDRPDEKRRGQIYVSTVDVTLWDEDRRFGRCLTTKDVTATVVDGVADLGIIRGRWADLTEDDAEHLKAAVLAAANAVEWPADAEAAALRAAADECEANARDWYGTDIFGDVGSADLAAVRSAMQARGKDIDNLSAWCFREALTTRAGILRRMADELTDTENRSDPR